jgi:RNA polymerase sigma-70 factor (ECF subfamily)
LVKPQPDDPDAELVSGAAAGDLDAFEALVRRHQARIVSFVRTLTRNAADAEDVAQEVFVRAHRALGRFRGESHFRSWLYAIASNTTRSHHAARARRQQVWEDSGARDARGFDPVDPAPDIETTLGRREAIERALAALPEDWRMAVSLRDVHGLEYKEIADVMGIPMGTVESRIFRARQRLRHLLAQALGIENEE